MKTDSDRDLHKQPFEDVLQNRCSKKSHNIHRKTLVLESPRQVFSSEYCKYLRTVFL